MHRPNFTQKIVRIILILFLLLLWISAPASATRYYLDSAAGGDGKPGTASDQAWKSFAKANAATFHPGDEILLKRGARWQGTLHPARLWDPRQPDPHWRLR